MLSVNDVAKLAQLGGASLAISLLLVLVALWRGWLEIGPAARREVGILTAYGEQMKGERDAFRAQVEARQSVVDQTLELAGLLREYAGQNDRARGNRERERDERDRQRDERDRQRDVRDDKRPTGER